MCHYDIPSGFAYDISQYSINNNPGNLDLKNILYGPYIKVTS